MEEMETNRNLEDGKDLRKVLVEEQKMTHRPKRSRCDFFESQEILRVRPLKFK